MKKILLVLLFSFSAAVQAEELKFVTVLSSPVGTFNRVEEVDSNTPVTSPVINFCTKRGSGNVQLNGRGNPTATTLNLASDAELGGNASEYRLQTLTMRYGGTLKGSRLLANTVNANSTPTLIKSSDIYASALNVQGAKTKKLNVGNGKSQITQSHKAEKMVWSNEHQQDKNGTTSADYAKQFLLKSQGTETSGTCPQTPGDPRTWWDSSVSKCGCPNADEYYHNGACCSDSTPTSDTRCWRATSPAGENLVWSNPDVRESFLTQNIANGGISSLTCNTEGIIGWTGSLKTHNLCPHYSCSGECVYDHCYPPFDGEEDWERPDFFGPCSKEGEICLARVIIERMDSSCTVHPDFPDLSCQISYLYSTCVKVSEGSENYQQLWDSSDTRYGCGH